MLSLRRSFWSTWTKKTWRMLVFPVKSFGSSWLFLFMLVMQSRHVAKASPPMSMSVRADDTTPIVCGAFKQGEHSFDFSALNKYARTSATDPNNPIHRADPAFIQKGMASDQGQDDVPYQPMRDHYIPCQRGLSGRDHLCLCLRHRRWGGR